MIFVLDNYDSFTYNLVQRLGEIDPALQIEVRRNDQVTVDEVFALAPSHVIISPGPCTPNEAGISCELAAAVAGKLPLLGVCLGHQSIGQASGGTIVRAPRLMHGKTDHIQHTGQGLFAGIESPMVATRYHSLIIDPDTLSDEYEVTAWSETPEGVHEIMGIQHREHPVFGIQFHPESFLTEHGVTMLQNFLAVAVPS